MVTLMIDYGLTMVFGLVLQLVLHMKSLSTKKRFGDFFL